MKKKHLIGPFMPNHEDFNGTSRQAFLLFRIIHVYHKADDSSKQILRLLLSMLQKLQRVESVTESNDFDLKKNRNFIYLIISKNR